MSTTTDPVKPNAVVKVAAQGMSLLKPIFQLEARLQATTLGALTNVDKTVVAQELADTIAKNKVVIYTYSLSPFSTQALQLLDASGYAYETIELGAEWFLLGGKASETRMALARQCDNGATSLPKIFIGGKCIGGYAELATLVQEGKLDGMMKSAGVRKTK
jgi:glutaredoxin